MDFFEKLGKKASETYKTATEKTNKIANETKLKMKINENKSKINNVYTEIGKKIYQKYVLDGNLDIENDIKEEIDRIKELTNEIEEFEKQKLELSDKKQCVNCKNKIEKQAKFCSICGAEQLIVEEVKEEIIEEAPNGDSENCAEEVQQLVEEVVVEESNEENGQDNNYEYGQESNQSNGQESNQENNENYNQ